jgi:hypothetical protein
MRKLIFSIKGGVLRYVNEDSLTGPAKAQLDSRRAAGYDILLPDRTDDHPQDPHQAENGLLLQLGGCIGVGFFTGAVFHNPAVGVVVGLIIAAICVAGAISNSEVGHRQTPSDTVDLLHATFSIRLPRYDALYDGVPGTNNFDLDLKKLGMSNKARNATGVRALKHLDYGAYSVLALIVVADRIVTEIARSRSWTSQYLSTHRARFYPADELCQIVDHALQLREAINKLGPGPTGDQPAAVMANRAYKIARQPLDLFWFKLLERVRALDDYKQNLVLLDTELENAEIAQRALGLSDNFQELFANAVGDEMAAEHLQNLSAEARVLTEAVTDIVATLDSNLSRLLALAPPE